MEGLPRHSHHRRGTEDSGEQRSLLQTPGRNGICLVFFKVNWDSTNHDMFAQFNLMFLDDRIMEQQKHGNVMCIPKDDIPTTPAEYRQITLLNTEYKTLSSVRTNRLKPTICLPHTSNGNEFCYRQKGYSMMHF